MVLVYFANTIYAHYIHYRNKTGLKPLILSVLQKIYYGYTIVNIQ